MQLCQISDYIETSPDWSGGGRRGREILPHPGVVGVVSRAPPTVHVGGDLAMELLETDLPPLRRGGGGEDHTHWRGLCQ